MVTAIGPHAQPTQMAKKKNHQAHKTEADRKKHRPPTVTAIGPHAQPTQMAKKQRLKKNIAHRGARTHDHKVKSLALYRLS
jgi:hypothetical protein